MIRFKMIHIRTGNNGWQLMIATRGGKTPRDKVCVGGVGGMNLMIVICSTYRCRVRVFSHLLAGEFTPPPHTDACFKMGYIKTLTCGRT